MEKSCYCVFCFENETKINEKGEKVNKEEEFPLFFNFLKLVERYILTDSSNYDGFKPFKLFKEVFKSGSFTVCEKCLKSVNSFCALYHDLETIQLLLNLQLWNLTNFIKESTWKVKQLKTRLCNPPEDTGLSRDSLPEKFIEYRKDFSKICKEKLLGSYPKLKIEKLPGIRATEDVLKLPTENTADRDHPQNSKDQNVHPFLASTPGIPLENENITSSTESISEANINDAVGVAEEIEGELQSLEDGADLECYDSPSPLVTAEVVNAKTEKKVESNLQAKTESFGEVKRQSEIFGLQESYIDEDLENYVSPAPSPKTTPVIKTEDSMKEIVENEGKEDTVEVKRNRKTFPPGSLPGSIKERKDFDEDYEMGQSDRETDSTSESSYDEESEKKRRKLKRKRSPNRSLSRSKSPPARVIKRKKRGNLKCPSCPKKYARLMEFKAHIRSKHPEELDSADFGFESTACVKYRFKCPECDEMFKEVHSLLLHYRDLHDSQINKKSSERSNLTIEILQFNVKTREKGCTPLLAEGKKTVYERIEIPPLEASTEVTICQVEDCHRVFYSQAEIKTHSKLHGSFACEFCEEKMDFLPELSMHEVRAHGGLKTLGKNVHSECKRCGENFRDVPNYLRHHASTHFGLDFGEQSCPVCKTYLISYERFRGSKFCKISSKYVNLDYLLNHIKNAHGLDSIKTGKRHKKEVIRCKEENCSAYFGTTLALAYHLKADHQLWTGDELKERSVRVCEECGKRCKNKEHFQLHLLSHSGPASWEFTCEICAKKCMTKQKLEEHLRVHTKEKPFVCELCGVKYAHRHNLRIHVKIKHGIDLKDIHTKK